MQKQAPRYQFMNKDHLNAVSSFWFGKMMNDPYMPEDIGSVIGANFLVKGMNEDEMDASPSMWLYLGLEFALDTIAAICADPFGDPTPAIRKARTEIRKIIRDSQINVVKRRPLTTLENEQLCDLEDAFNKESFDG
ncbi:MAG: hypothetical protein GIW99_09180 [Candidatus Eremiobacteraeota bacterium]|nr:hypothetical protein [Candidatus Eremiobacteraeota bacterium]MBC5827836.1 hypothetical protein [Candidatus Eremiobacteraeota bacterium]